MYYESVRDVTQTPRYVYYENIHAPLHFHQAIEMVYCIEGCFYVQSGSNSYLLEKDEIAFFPSYFPHALTPVEYTKSLTYMLPLKYFEIFTSNDLQLSFQKLDNRTLNIKLRQLLEESCEHIDQMQKDVKSALLFQGYAQMILGLITKHYEPLLEHSQENVKWYNELIINIIKYIEDHYKEKINLEDIAKKFGYSKWYFSRFFNKTFNCSLPSYVNAIRFSKVEQHKSSEMNKTDTILEEGFPTLSAYYKAKNGKTFHNKNN